MWLCGIGSEKEIGLDELKKQLRIQVFQWIFDFGVNITQIYEGIRDGEENPGELEAGVSRQ